MSPFARAHADAVAVLTKWSPPDKEQVALRDRYVAVLADGPPTVMKAGPPEHLTASCVVLSADLRSVLLTHHRKAALWLQFGGHLESSDPGLAAAAQREAREESGLDDLVVSNPPIELHRHTLSAAFGHCRAHLDVRYAAVAALHSRPTVSAESLDVRWWPVDALPEDSPEELRVLVGRAVSALRRHVREADTESDVGSTAYSSARR